MMHVAPDKVQMDRAADWGQGEVFGVPTEGLDGIRVDGIGVAVPLDMRT